MESNLSISPHLNSLLPQFSNQNSQFCPEIPSDELFDVLKKDPITEYEEIYSDFMRFSNSQISVLLLRRVLQNPKIPHEFRSQALYRLIVDSYQILTLNEMEIAVWGFYLEKIVWNDSSSKLDYVLLYSALAAKSSTNPCIAPYLAFLSSKISNFFANYNN